MDKLSLEGPDTVTVFHLLLGPRRNRGGDVATSGVPDDVAATEVILKRRG